MSAKLETQTNDDIPLLNPIEILLMLLAFAGGALAAAVLLPAWLPGLSASLLGDAPKAYWYLARAAGVIAYLLLWLSMVFGMVVSNKMARLWNGGPTAIELHQFVTWLAIAFSVLHALILLGDKYISATLVQVLTPFAYSDYEPFWVGMGQIGFYVCVLIAASFYFRKQSGYRAWRALHYGSFVLYLVLTLHGIFAGTDTAAPGMMLLYLGSALIVYFLLLVRILNAIRTPRVTPHGVVKSSPTTVTRRG
ncbi:MAG: hypothetical protein B6D41_12105 [Chloroflexi bacterium UTCFX4]|jgi:predicted ferric reductase|nr:MAG: hypothetical protein B6D41_12105 [Chloroflexi bacterium UTCFX4]